MESPEPIFFRPTTPVLHKPETFNPSFGSTTPIPLRPSNKYEDRPVKHPLRTFEELVDEELRKSNEREDLKLLERRKNSTQFLKRGQGTLCSNTKSPKGRARESRGQISDQNPKTSFTPSKSATRLVKASSHINNLKKLAQNIGDGVQAEKISPEIGEDNRKIRIKPLELYKIRREKWKIRENAVTDRKSFEKIIEKLTEDEKDQEIVRLRNLLQKSKKNESFLMKEIEDSKKQIEELKSQNLRLMNENFKLKANSKVSNKKTFETGKSAFDKERPTERQELVYSNGTKRVVYSNGYSVVYYTNKDVKEEFPDGKQVYFFADPETFQIIYPNGVKEVKFKTGQEEVFYPNGTRDIKFPDGSHKTIHPELDDKFLPSKTVLG